MQDERDQFVVGTGLTIVGDIDAAGSLRVEGSVRGRVFVRGTLDVAPGAVVEGFVQALDIDVHGRLAGVVRAAGEVRLHPEGQVSGDVEAPKVRFVKSESPAAVPPARHAVSTPAVPPPPVPPPTIVPPPPPPEEEEEPPALPPVRAGQAQGVLPSWPPQGISKAPPVWAPRSARPASNAPPPPVPPVASVDAAPAGDGEPPPAPSITGGQRQIVVRRR